MIKATEKASKIIIRDFGEIEKLQVSKKGPNDFVTNSDLKVEKIIIEELRKARQPFSFLIEENGKEINKNKKIYSPKKDYYEGNTYKFFNSKFKKILKKDILLKELHNYDEILLVGSGKGIASVKTIKQTGWKRKNLKQFKVLSKYYKSIINKCTPYRFC